MNKAIYLIFLAKSIRTFMFGVISILIPIYLASLNYPVFYVTLGIFFVVLGNVIFNLLLALYESLIGRKNFLIMYSLLMMVAGIILLLSSNLVLISIALFIGNISVTGTETGPFQSVEVGVIPKLVKNPGRVLGVYNLLGYSFSSLGALSLSLLSHLITNNVTIAKLIYALYIITSILLAAIYKKIVNIEVSSNKVNASLVNVFLNSDVRNLSILFAVDAFGGSLITQSLLALWFYLRYHVSEAYLGIIFSVSSIITAISLIIAPLIAERIGNLRTMVFTHMVSNVFLILIPLMNSLQWSVAFLFLRQSFSQMDVPTRQAFISQIFSDEERVKVYAITNIFRNISSLPGPILVGLVFSLKLLYLPFLISGTLKLGYDNTIYQIYKNRAR
ncbi:MAG: MFS transporter [Vulcanisaeta sp.]